METDGKLSVCYRQCHSIVLEKGLKFSVGVFFPSQPISAAADKPPRLLQSRLICDWLLIEEKSQALVRSLSCVKAVFVANVCVIQTPHWPSVLNECSLRPQYHDDITTTSSGSCFPRLLKPLPEPQESFHCPFPGSCCWLRWGGSLLLTPKQSAAGARPRSPTFLLLSHLSHAA